MKNKYIKADTDAVVYPTVSRPVTVLSATGIKSAIGLSMARTDLPTDATVSTESRASGGSAKRGSQSAEAFISALSGYALKSASSGTTIETEIVTRFYSTSLENYHLTNLEP